MLLKRCMAKQSTRFIVLMLIPCILLSDIQGLPAASFPSVSPRPSFKQEALSNGIEFARTVLDPSAFHWHQVAAKLLTGEVPDYVVLDEATREQLEPLGRVKLKPNSFG